jgi:signal transduction histidine kinase
LKRFLHFTSLHQKLRAVIVATTGIVLLLVTLAFVINEAVTYRRAIRQELTALASIIGMNATAGITNKDQKLAAIILESLSSKPHVNSAALVLPDGTILAKYGAPSEAADKLKLLLSGSGNSAGDTRRAFADYKRHAEQAWSWDIDEEVIVPVLLDGQEIGMVVISSSLIELYDRLKGFFVMVVLITYIAIGIAYGVATRLQRPILEPILQIVDTMKVVSDRKDYNVRAQKQSNDESGQLIDGFNEMLSQIQKRDADLERYAAELQDGNEELKSFIYSAAHDLRAPLVNVRGFTAELGRAAREFQGLAARHADCIPEESRRRMDAIVQEDMRPAMEFIDTSVERMHGLINALLKISQLGHRDLRPELIDVQEMAHTILRSLQDQIGQKNIAVEVRDLPAVTADRVAMEQIIVHLLDNAMKYVTTSRPGSIIIGSRNTEEETVFFVQDNGRGIRKDDMPKLFKIFRRLGPQDVPGDGVGLAYIKTLVKRHGGRIWCESESGKGSVFFFTIPARYARAKRGE